MMRGPRVTSPYFAVVLIGYPDGEPPWRISRNEFWNLPARWDTGWYLGIARHGYTWNSNDASQQNLNFFPAFPMAVRVGGFFTDNPLSLAWVGVLIAILAFLAALLYLHRLMVSLAHAPAAPGAVMLMATYPFALFFSTAYSESLYPARLGWSPLRALRNDRYKVIVAPRPELYDLISLDLIRKYEPVEEDAQRHWEQIKEDRVLIAVTPARMQWRYD